MSSHLIHDVSEMMAREIVQIFAPLLRDDEMLDALAEVRWCVQAGLETYKIKSDRIADRLAKN